MCGELHDTRRGQRARPLMHAGMGRVRRGRAGRPSAAARSGRAKLAMIAAAEEQRAVGPEVDAAASASNCLMLRRRCRAAAAIRWRRQACPAQSRRRNRIAQAVWKPGKSEIVVRRRSRDRRAAYRDRSRFLRASPCKAGLVAGEQSCPVHMAARAPSARCRDGGTGALSLSSAGIVRPSAACRRRRSSWRRQRSTAPASRRSLRCARPTRRTCAFGIMMRASAMVRTNSMGSIGSASPSGVPLIGISMLIGTLSGCSGRLASVTSMSIAIDRLLAHADDAAAADLDAGCRGHAASVSEPVGEGAGGDDLAVIALRGVDVVIVIVEAGLLQALRLARDPACRASCRSPCQVP